MVNVVKSIFFILFIQPALSLPAWSNASIETVMKQTTGEYGKPVYIKIIAEDSNDKLTSLSLDTLTDEFAIANQDFEDDVFQRIGSSGKAVEISRQTLKIKMYPRTVGELSIPAFILGKAVSLPTLITISDAYSKGNKISLASEQSATKVWQRQQIRLSFTLQTNEQFASIKLREQAVPGVEITALPVVRRWDESKNGGVSTMTGGWSLLPLQSGLSTIDLPPLEYHLNGVVRRVFHLPKVKLSIRPLPSYLPPTIPVGKIELSSTISSENLFFASLLNTKKLAYWNISISSKTLTPYWLPSILRQVKSNESIQFFPANSVRSMQLDKHSVNGKVSHSIPFKLLKQGHVKLPEIRIQYFDPLSGKLATQKFPSTQIYSINAVSISLLSLIALALSVIAIYLIYLQLRRGYNFRRNRRLAILSIRQSRNTAECIAAISRLSKAEGWQANLSLTNWRTHWKKKYSQVMPKDKQAQLDKLISTISRLHYGKRESPTSAVGLSSLMTDLSNILTANHHWYQYK